MNMSEKSAAKIFIYSTLSSDMRYTFWQPRPKNSPSGPGVKDPNIPEIVIKGGANVADKHGVASKGVVTPISSEEWEKLKTHKVFKKHFANKYVWADSGKKDIDIIVDGAMEARDQSAPMTPKTYEDAGKKPPKTKKVE